MKQTLVNVTVRLVINHDTDLDEIIDNMDYDFSNKFITGAEIVDTEILDYEVINPEEEE